MKRKTVLVLAAIAISISMSDAVLAAEKRLSLNPYGSQLDNDAIFLLSSSHAPIVLPSEFRPTFYNGFTIPDDYKGGALTLELLVESEAVNCSFHLRPDALFRMRLRRSGEFGNTGVGFEGRNASTTPFSLAAGNGIVFAAEDIPHETVRVRFEISDEGEDIPLAPGDGIHFGIFRETNGNDDTCSLPLHVGGMSIVYNNRRGLAGPGGFKRR